MSYLQPKDNLLALGWTHQDRQASRAEGWRLIMRNGRVKIERTLYGKFSTDDAAIEFVKLKFDRWSELHMKALRISVRSGME